MKHYKLLSILVILSFFIISCGDDDDNHNGFYEVTKHEQQANSCSGDFTLIESFDFFKIEEINFFGVNIDTLSECDTNKESSCEEDNGTWLGESSWSMGSTGICSIGKSTFKISSDSDGITITETSKIAKITLKDGEECDTDLTDKYESQLECDTINVLEGKRL